MSYDTTPLGSLLAFTSGVLIAGGAVLMTSAEPPAVHPTRSDDVTTTTTFAPSKLIQRVPSELLAKRFIMKSFGLGSFFVGMYFFAPTFLRQAWSHDIHDASFYVKLALGSFVMLMVS